MPKISQLESATDVTANDFIQIIDVEDSGMAPSGTNKKVTASLLAKELAKQPLEPGIVISGSSSGNAVRITQTGSGNALVVEDSVNPDGTPFVVSSNGTVGIGETSPQLYVTAGMVLKGASANTPTIFNWNTTNDINQSTFIFRKDRAGAAVVSGDRIGFIGWNAYDGDSYYMAAGIEGAVDGSPSTDNMPGRLVFQTTPSGSATRLERMRITNSGNVGIGTISPSASCLLHLTSTTSGFRPPSMTTAQRDLIATPIAGVMIYNNSTNKLNFYNGSAWEAVTSSV